MFDKNSKKEIAAFRLPLSLLLRLFSLPMCNLGRLFFFLLTTTLCCSALCAEPEQKKQKKASPPASNEKQTAKKTPKELRTSPDASLYTQPLVFPNPSHEHQLPELIDIAQRRNRTTRAAWEKARAAAAASGVVASEFYPMLAVMASYGGGFWDFNLDANNNLSGLKNQAGILGALFSDAIPQDISLDQKAAGFYRSLNTGATLRWMLFDFGTRAARHDASKKIALAANFAFDGSHQTVAYEVTQSYYAILATRRQTAAATSSVRSADEIENAAQARFNQGLITEPFLLQARQAKAQSYYALATARSAEELAWIDLTSAMNLPPETRFPLALPNFSAIRKQLEKPIDEFIRSALKDRPDLLAKVAIVQAREAELRASRSDRLPKLSLLGVAAYNRFDTTTQNTGPLDSFGFGLQNYGGFLTVEWPVFTGFAEENRTRAANAAKAAATEELALAKEKAISEIWRAYTNAKNAIARNEAAEALQTATRATYAAMLASFEQGLVPIQDVFLARTAETQAQMLVAESEYAIASSLASLAFSSGTIQARKKTPTNH